MNYRKAFWIVTVILVLLLALVTLYFVRCHAARFAMLHGRSANNPPAVEFRWGLHRLAPLDQIHSPRDAEALIRAIGTSWWNGIGFYALNGRLAAAEYDAARDPRKRIPESTVAIVFNRRIDTFRAPKTLYITPEILHAYRLQTLARDFPAFVLSADGSLPKDCRPIEAVVLLHELDLWGAASSIRELAPTLAANQTSEGKVKQIQLSTQRAAQLDEAIESYFLVHADERYNDVFSKRTLDELGIQ